MAEIVDLGEIQRHIREVRELEGELDSVEIPSLVTKLLTIVPGHLTNEEGADLSRALSVLHFSDEISAKLAELANRSSDPKETRQLKGYARLIGGPKFGP